MKIVEGIQATGDHVWIVIECAADGKEVETGFRTKAEAKAYRAALFAYRQMPDRRLLMSVERLRRSAIITYGHGRSPVQLELCTECKQDAARFPAGPLYVEWSDNDTVEGDGCVAEMFCSWECAARWFIRGRPRKATQAGLDLPSQQ